MTKKYKYWGQIKGGKISSGTTKKILIPPENEKLSELIGIILGDGNLYTHQEKKSSSYMIRITGDGNKDREYLLEYVKPLCESLFGLEIKVREHRTFNELFIVINSKNALQFLVSKGLKEGDKIKNKVGIPKWIVNNKRFLRACIRGLIDTDGSLYELKPHWPGLWQICFTSKSRRIITDVRNGLIELGIGCSNIYEDKNPKRALKLYITKKSELGKFYKEIGFSNPKHQNKLKPRGVVD